MTATKELRQMLDERGVKHYDITPVTYWGELLGRFETCWGERFDKAAGYAYVAIETDDKLLLKAYNLTPAQTIEVTLGCEECEPVVVDCYDGLLPPFTVHCSACGEGWGFTPNYCPHCGRKVRKVKR